MYLRCGEQYRRRYLLKEIIPPGIALLKGTTGHAGAEINFVQKIKSKSDLPLKDVQEYASSVFDDTLKAQGIGLTKEELSVGKQKILGDAKDYVVMGILPLMHEKMFPLYQPIEVETLNRIELPSSPYDFVIKMDLATENGIVDYKIIGKAKSQSEIDSSLQLTGYAAGYKVRYKKEPKEIVLEQYVKRKSGPERVVGTTSRDKNDFKALANKILTVGKAIQSGVFLPAQPGSWACSDKFCGYYRSCPYVNYWKDCPEED